MKDAVANQTAKLQLTDQSLDLPVVVGSENEHAFDIGELRSKTGYVTLDEGYGNTGSCQSGITFINGEEGILRYRGIPIEQLAEHSSFVETAMLLIYGELPTKENLARFRALLTEHEMLHEGLRQAYQGFPQHGHPMAILSAMINAIGCYQPDVMQMEDEVTFEAAAARLLSKVRTIAAAAYKSARGEPIMYPKPGYGYAENFLHMMFSLPYADHEPDPEVVNALQLFLILHADHEQNCSTSTVRMVASSGANMFASCAAGVCALWGPKHGGANVAVINMLQHVHDGDFTVEQYMDKVRKKEALLWGFGHRVYKSYDPRAKILQKAADRLLKKLDLDDPLLDTARQMEEVALNDDYFKERNLYPNVDFYSGIILRAIGIPVNMFTVMFAIGRMPGWIANFKEVHDADSRIYRPRQVYTGPTQRDYVPVDQRG
ncbi:MAG: citrate synthase [Phycisphaeraceae bacterium]